MQITIDTQKDSKADIRKAVAFLSSIAEGKKKHSNIFEDSSPGLRLNSEQNDEPSIESSASNAFANMFGNSNKKVLVPEKDLDEEESSKEGKEEDLEIDLMEY